VVSEHVAGDGPARVLVVEDDVTVSEVVERYLKREGFEVECVADGVSALRRATATLPDLVILDIMLPEMDGLEVCRKLQAQAPIPIIMLTALGEESDRIMGLELGADDYVTKPFSPRELTARVKSVLRRARGPLHSTAPELRAPLTVGDLQIDIAAHEVTIQGQPVSLTAREFELLVWLVLHPRQVFTREDLLAKVWGYSYGDESTVTVHVRRLREKVELNPTDPHWIKTVWGVGYRFDP
jgi:DNA-binding response OmpR family regulator